MKFFIGDRIKRKEVLLDGLAGAKAIKMGLDGSDGSELICNHGELLPIEELRVFEVVRIRDFEQGQVSQIDGEVRDERHGRLGLFLAQCFETIGDRDEFGVGGELGLVLFGQCLPRGAQAADAGMRQALHQGDKSGEVTEQQTIFADLDEMFEDRHSFALVTGDDNLETGSTRENIGPFDPIEQGLGFISGDAAQIAGGQSAEVPLIDEGNLASDFQWRSVQQREIGHSFERLGV